MSLKEKAGNQNKEFVVALDGPSAAGKGLIGKMLASEFGLQYVQSSIVYRGLAYLCAQNNVSPSDIDAVTELSKTPNLIALVKDVDLNNEQVAAIASQISTIPEVRENLTHYLVSVIKQAPRIIMEGRDIGTVVAPDADLKIFLTASPEVRAERRYKQLINEGKNCILSEILSKLQERDARDSTRSQAPLRAAEDALVIDTSNLLPEEVLQKIKDFIYCS